MRFYCKDKILDWEPKRLIIAGYTGKDQAAVNRHIEELKELGVPAPPRVPMIYDLSPELMRPVEEITVVRNESSGEAEAVLMQIGGVWYLGLGSDHTDRSLETLSIQKSKQVCIKPVSSELWPLNDVVDDWDDIRMQSWVIQDGVEYPYQEGTLGSFLNPDELMQIIQERGFNGENMAIFCGTLPLKDGTFLFGERFRASLHDPKSGRTIQFMYNIKILKDAEEE